MPDIKVLKRIIKYTFNNFFLDNNIFLCYILFGGGKEMNKISYAVKVDPSIIKRIKEFCLEHGIKQGFFVEKALREQLAREELTEDLLDFRNLRSQEGNAISFEDYLKKRAS